MASRSLLDLRDDVRLMAVAMEKECAKVGIDLLIYCTWRSKAEQAVEYAKGRTAPGKIVTNAKPGQSKHNAVNRRSEPASLAFDCVPIINGKAVWDSKNPIWQKVGEIGESVGLEWAGRWKTFKEFPHFQAKE